MVLRPLGIWFTPEVKYKRPTEVIQLRHASSMGKSFLDKLPGPIRSLLPVVGTAGLLFFVAAPALLVFLPPVCLGAMIYLRQIRRKRASLFEKRWTEMASYHMTLQSEQAALNEQETLKKMAMRRVAEAIQDNESGIAERLGFKVASPKSDREMSVEEKATLFNRSHLALSDVRSIEEDWRVSPQGIAQSMTVYTLSLVDKNRQNLKVAEVDIVVKSRLGSKAARSFPSRTKDVRIELTSAVGTSKKHFVLDGPDSEGEGKVIDVKKRR